MKQDDVNGVVIRHRPAPARGKGRRAVLRGTGVLVGRLALGSPLALVAPSSVWALELATLDAAEGRALLMLGRVLFPHDRLPDAVYALLVKALDEAVTQDAEARRQVRDGLRALDRGNGGRFVDSDAQERLRRAKALEGTPFFERVRSEGITSLYDNDMTWTAFGYQGSSWQHGGYLLRGFQDLDWLPEPSPEASPPLPGVMGTPPRSPAPGPGRAGPRPAGRAT